MNSSNQISYSFSWVIITHRIFELKKGNHLIFIFLTEKEDRKSLQVVGSYKQCALQIQKNMSQNLTSFLHKCLTMHSWTLMPVYTGACESH